MRATQDSTVVTMELKLVGVHILIADDSADEREMLAFILERQGARVTTVDSAEEALVAVTKGKPHILVSDIALRDRDGYSLIRELRSRPPSDGGQTPAIALTGWARSSDRSAALDAGFQVHLSKPVEFATLVAVVSSLASFSGQPIDR